MFQVAIFYDHPADPGSFDEHHAGPHAPYHLVTLLYWSSEDQARTALGGQAGAAAAQDATAFAGTPSFVIEADTTVVVDFAEVRRREMRSVLGLYDHPAAPVKVV